MMFSIATNIVNPISDSKYDFLPNQWLNIDKGIISSISEKPQFSQQIDKRNCICLPGLIDVHVHLSQYDIMGHREPDLLSWLNKNVFSAEYRSTNDDYAYDIAKRFFRGCLRAGTTTTVVYTSPYKKACDIAFQVAEELQVRSIIGMTMMDANCPEYLKQETDKSLQFSSDLCEKWQKKELLDYIYTPRFALSCSEELLRETAKLASNHKARIQSHLSENKREIETAKEMFPNYSSYTDIYYRTGILGKRTIMGHCIHLEDDEIHLMNETDTRIAFCPDSNFFLKSGRFPFWKLHDAGIKIAIASDVGGGTDLSMFEMMKLADYTIENKGISISNALYFSTLASAEVIGLKDKIGSIELGKEADLLFVKSDNISKECIEQELSSLIYLKRNSRIDSTWVKGKKLFQSEI